MGNTVYELEFSDPDGNGWLVHAMERHGRIVPTAVIPSPDNDSVLAFGPDTVAARELCMAVERLELETLV